MPYKIIELYHLNCVFLNSSLGEKLGIFFLFFVTLPYVKPLKDFEGLNISQP